MKPTNHQPAASRIVDASPIPNPSPHQLQVRASVFRFERVAVVVAGALLIAAGLAADVFFSGRSPGLGLVQLLPVLGGLASIGVGVGSGAPLVSLRTRWAQMRYAATRERVFRYGALAIQLALVTWAISLYQIESPAFYTQIMPLTIVGFVIHHLLPHQQRLSFFVGLSLAAILLVFGIAQGLWLVGTCLLTIATCHLPVRWPLRIAFLVAIAIGLMAMRSGIIHTPWSVAVWPILGAILMFRIVIYVYDLRHSPNRPTVSQTLAYFFLLPNVAFPLFPVVDFSTFRRTYYDRDPLDIYHRGAQWMLRGITHLLLYRIVYQYLVVPGEEVATAGDLAWHILTTFLLYLRVSGQFHLVIGMLHLFGFRLPETHLLFYLASSFTDFWRRINIYWKDFMMKVVFYPTFLPLRRHGDTFALVTATLTVFAVTWFAHSYQWFWILGSWLLSWPDVLFWAILAVLLVFNSLLELSRSRRRRLTKQDWSFRSAVELGFKTAATFAIISSLWSLWSSPTLGDWVDLISVGVPSWQDGAAVVAVLALVGVAAILAAWRGRTVGAAERLPQKGGVFSTSIWPTASLTVICALAVPQLSQQMPPKIQGFLRDIRSSELSRQDAQVMERGYYENLIDVSVQNSELWRLYAQRPRQGADIWQSGVMRTTDDFLGREIRPLVATYHAGISFRTNKWGMRDREYDLVAPPGTYRIALLGQSYVAGDGVNDGETFEALAEARLNAVQHDSTKVAVEILNFAAGSYSVLQQLVLLQRVFSFQPDAVYFVASPGDDVRALRHLIRQLRAGVEPPFSYLKQVLVAADVNSTLRETEAMRRLLPWKEDVLRWAYEELARQCSERDITPVWIYLYLPQAESAGGPEVGRLEDMAKSAGLRTLSLADVYDGYELESLQVSPVDYHPNALGHEVIAERLYRDLTARTDLGLPRELGHLDRKENP